MNFRLPPESLTYLCHQRTDYCELISRIYLADMKKELHLIEPHLPEKIVKVLDIGCGLAGIDVLIAKRYGAKILLLDKNGLEDKSKIGFQNAQDFAAYNSFVYTKQLMEQNGIRDVGYYDVNVGEPIGERFDLILSLYSWCFHYPFDVYATKVRNALLPGGRVVVDVRKGQEIPWKGQVIRDGRKSRRMVFKAEEIVAW